MTRFKSVLCASFLTLALSSSAFATGKAGIITSKGSTTSNKTGIITSMVGDTTGLPGTLSAEEIRGLIDTMFGVIAMVA